MDTITQDKPKAKTQAHNKKSRHVKRKPATHAQWSKSVKSVSKQIQLTSTFMNRRMSTETHRFENAFIGLASLIYLTTNSPEIRTRLDEWWDTANAISIEAVESLNIKQLEFMKNVEKHDDDMIIPDSFNVTILISHPVFWRPIKLLQMIDKGIAEYEKLWILGEINDDDLFTASNQYNKVLHQLIHRTFALTKISKDRENGIYSASDFSALHNDLKKSLGVLNAKA